MRKAHRSLLGVSAAVASALLLFGLVALTRVFLQHPALAAEIAGGALVAAALSTFALARLAQRVPPATVLELDLPNMPPEVRPGPQLAQVGGARQLTLSETVAALARAADDPRVKGLVLRPRFSRAPQAAIEELREAVAAFARSGKKTVAVSDTFGEELGQGANGAYVLATACSELVLHPGGELGLVPLSVEKNFYRGLLDRLGVELEVFAREEFKSALDQFTEEGPTGPDREQRQAVLDSLWGAQVGYIADARHLDPVEVRRLADLGPLTAAEAVETGLVDRLAYTDETIAAAKSAAGPKAKLLYVAEYKRRARPNARAGKRVPVAVLHAAGEIRRFWPLPFGATSRNVVAADRLAAQIRAVGKDKRVRALVVRVDSPGGSAIASESIWRELSSLRDKGKPVVVSMGAVAASGGYYIATAADRVIAQPGTITGSIGVLAAHPVLAGAKSKLGVNPAEIHTGARPGFSPNRPLLPEQRERLDILVDTVYKAFIDKVASGRRTTPERARELGKGRVWTGADALRMGLVDELGGLRRATEVALELAGAPAGARPKLVEYPKRRSPLAQLLRREPASSDDVGQAASCVVGTMPSVLVAAAREAFLAAARETLSGGYASLHLGHSSSCYWVP
jgi:protease-4